MLSPHAVGLIAAIGQEEKLPGQTLERFINFMAARFPRKESEDYTREWAQRFKASREYSCADSQSTGVLLQIDREMKRPGLRI